VGNRESGVRVKSAVDLFLYKFVVDVVIDLCTLYYFRSTYTPTATVTEAQGCDKAAMLKSNSLKQKHSSISSLISIREQGRCSSCFFKKSLTTNLAKNKVLLEHPDIVSPHQGGISSLSFDKVDGRFLLAGSSDATASIFDLSQWGSDKVLRQTNSPNMFRPIARSLRVPATTNEHELPKGHTSSITHVQFYAVDTGAFLSVRLSHSVSFCE
jgi:WD40 repeat protein